MAGMNDLSAGVKIFIAAVAAYAALLFPAAMVFLPFWKLETYIIGVGIFILGILPVSLTIYKIYWDGQKFLTAQVTKQPFNSFKETIDKLKEYTLTENEERRLPMLKGAFFDKILNPKTVLPLTLIIGLVLIVAPTVWVEYLWPLAYIGFLIPFKTYRNLYSEWNSIEQVRNQQVSRIYDIIKPIMKFELPPQYCIMVAAWEDKTTPKQINIIYPPSFRGDNQQARDSFESAFSATITDDNAWIYTWYPTKSAVVCRPVEDIPKFVDYKGSGMFEWHTFPVGVGLGDKGQEIISYSVSKNKSGIYHPHVLIAGTTGSGKSVIQRNILFHCIQHNDMWRFLGIDLKQVELGKYEKYSQTVMGVATNLEDGVKFLRYAQEVMSKRYEKMKEAGVSLFLDLVNEETGKPDPALMLMIDEAYEFLAPSGIKSAQGKMEDELHQEAAFILSSVARLGRAAGIHLVLATQRPDATVIKGEMKNNLDVRIAAGRLDNTPSLMVLDSSAATTLPDIKGRGVVRLANKTRQFQGFYADDDWIDKWLSKPQNRWREPELTAKMFPESNTSDAPIRAQQVETETVKTEDSEALLEEFLEEIAEHETPTDNGVEITEEFIGGIEGDNMEDLSYVFDDELGLAEQDDISDEEIEQLLNELSKIEENDGPLETHEKVEPVEATTTEDDGEAFEKIFEKETDFESEFEKIFNLNMVEINTTRHNVEQSNTVENFQPETPPQMEKTQPQKQNIYDKIKTIPKPPPLNTITPPPARPTPPKPTNTDAALPKKPAFPKPPQNNTNS